MNTQQIHQQVKETFSNAILEFVPIDEKSKTDSFIEVQPEKIYAILKYLREDDALNFDNLLCISGVDYKDKFEVVYHLHSYKHLHKVVVKVSLSNRDNAKIDTVSNLWKGADWLEREVFDMYGISFNNHPDLRRILLPDDWQGYPLRKDYKEQETWHDIKVGM